MEPPRSKSDDPDKPFSEWVKENGGDDDFISILANSGFTSYLSLRFLDVGSEDGKGLCEGLNFGQRCLLQGLVSLLGASVTSDSASDAYGESLRKAKTLVAQGRAPPLRQKLGQLFHWGRDSKATTSCPSSSQDAFHPVPAQAGMKRKGKGKAPAGGKLRKVKEVQLKVVGLTKPVLRTPKGDERDRLSKEIWIRTSASPSEIEDNIRKAFGWSHECRLHFMYAQGRNLRKARLEDVEGAVHWDFAAVKSLMGSGALYVVSEEQPTCISDSEESDVEFESNLQRLQEIFRQQPASHLRSLLLAHGMHKAIDILIGEVVDELRSGECSSRLRDSQTLVPASMPQLAGSSKSRQDGPLCTGREMLQRHAATKVDEHAEYSLTVDRTSRESLWRSVVGFYKSALLRPKKLRKRLVVSFEGEAGADAGSLRKEFFEDSIKEANLRLFEGDDKNRVPKKEWSLEGIFEVAGMLVAHSLLQDGPGLPCLCPAIFQYLVSDNPSDCLPTKEDIPLNLSTHELITFIEKIDKASTEDDLDSVIDEPNSMSIINTSAWGITEPVTVLNKTRLLQQLILEEVIIKREHNMRAFLKGLAYLGVNELLTKHPELMRDFFCDNNQELSAEKFFRLIKDPILNDDRAKVAYDFFKEFIIHLEDAKQTAPGARGVSIATLLRFITGMSTVPPLALEMPIQIVFLPPQKEEQYPKVTVCYCKLSLPVIHETFSDFKAAFTTALTYGDGYGRV